MEALLKQLENDVQNNNIENGWKILQQIKVMYFTTFSNDEELYRTALEYGVLLSIAAEDMDQFYRHIQQLIQPYYHNMNNTTASSPRKNHVIGLYLMFLLVENRLSEFHSELELLLYEDDTSSSAYEEDIYIQFPISLERKMMVGLYDEILEMLVPHPTYQFFFHSLHHTVRDLIADCMEVTYPSLSIVDTIDLLKCSDETELLEYISSLRDDWMIDHDNAMITFQPDQVVAAANNTDSTTASSSAPLPPKQEIPSMKWIQQALAYATEMERIV